jgi:hypothetical protein
MASKNSSGLPVLCCPISAFKEWCAGAGQWYVSQHDHIAMKRIAMCKAGAFLAFLASALLLNLSCSSTPKALSLSPHTGDKWNALVRETIPEQQRATKVRELGLQLETLSDSMKAAVEQLSAKGAALNEKYSSTREEMQSMLAEFAVVRKRILSKYREVVFAMRGQVNEREWEKLTD